MNVQVLPVNNNRSALDDTHVFLDGLTEVLGLSTKGLTQATALRPGSRVGYVPDRRFWTATSVNGGSRLMED